MDDSGRNSTFGSSSSWRHCMITTYSHSERELRRLQQIDPWLPPQPESYFVLLEEKEDDLVCLSYDTALMTSLLLLWQTAHFSYGKVALLLYKRRGPWSILQWAFQWLKNCISMSLPIFGLWTLKSDYMEGHFQAPLVLYCIPSCAKNKSKNENSSSGCR